MATAVVVYATPAHAALLTHRHGAVAVPSATGDPVLSGTVKDGSTLTVSDGSWTGSPTSYAYAWTRCDRYGNGCFSAGAGASHLVTSDDVGHTLKATVTARNASGAGSAFVLSAVVAATLPANSSLPLVAGRPLFGTKLAATTGTWTGSTPMTYAYAWQSSADGTTWAGIGVVTSTYTMTPSVAGRQVRVAVTASNAAGATTAYSTATGAIAAVPSNTAGPRLSSSIPKLGDTLTGTSGSWSGSPAPAYTYQWQYSDTCASWANIAGATSVSYVVSRAVVNDCLRLVVTACNSAGATTSASGSTARVLAPPAIVSAPVLRASLPIRVGTVLTAGVGSWSASPSCIYSYVWQTSADNVTWTVVNAAVASRLAVPAAFLGRFVRVAITAKNALGSTTEYSAAVGGP